MYSGTFTSFGGAFSFSILQGKQFLNRQLFHRRTLCRLFIDLGEIFTIPQLQGSNVKMKGRFDAKELPPTISAQIKRIEVTCGVVDERVTKVLKFLSKLNISKLANRIHAFDISVHFNICRKLKSHAMKNLHISY